MSARQHSVPPAFGRRLRRERDRRGWSLRECAARCDMNATTIMRAEAGRDMALSHAIQLAAMLGLSLDALLAASACAVCDGMPPEGFICAACGAGGQDIAAGDAG